MSNEVNDFDIDAALESGDPELIEKALAAAGESDIYAEQDEAKADDDGFSLSEKAEKPDAKNDDVGDGEGVVAVDGHDAQPPAEPGGPHQLHLAPVHALGVVAAGEE